jgi:hypothetical protein
LSADALISRLEKAKRTGAGTWLACCPAHEDKSPSLSIRELDDGRVLVHCFAGCGVDEILGAVGMDFDALFPEKPPHADHTPPLHRPFPAADVLEAVASETFYVAFMAAALANSPVGYGLADTDRALLWQSYERIMEARRLALGER